MPGRPAARAADPTAHGGVLLLGAPTVLIGGAPAARAGDPHVCSLVTIAVAHVGGGIVLGSSSVLIGGAPAARMGDPCPCGTAPVSLVEALQAAAPPPARSASSVSSNDGTFDPKSGSFSRQGWHEETQQIDEDGDGVVDVTVSSGSYYQETHEGSFAPFGIEIFKMRDTEKFGYVEQRVRGLQTRETELGMPSTGYSNQLEGGAVKMSGEATWFDGLIRARIGSKGGAYGHTADIHSPDDPDASFTGSADAVSLSGGATVDLGFVAPGLFLFRLAGKSVDLSADASGGVGAGGGFDLVNERVDGRQQIGIRGVRIGEFGGDFVLSYGDVDPPPMSDEEAERFVALISNVAAAMQAAGIPNVVLGGFPSVLIGG